jgi:DNA-binding MarR family transcriptional regulator
MSSSPGEKSQHGKRKKPATTPVKASPGVCSEAAVSAWARLVRVQHDLVNAVEDELKQAGFPPLAWYDALLELSRAENGYLRPLELERAMLFPQYAMSRLIDRLVAAGYVERRICPIDGRGQFVVITASGRALRKKMWNAYAAAIERHVGVKLTRAEAVQLHHLLGKLTVPQEVTPPASASSPRG